MSSSSFGLPTDLSVVAGDLSYDQHLYDAESGHYISQRMRRVAEIIHDYDPNMELVWIPPSDRSNVDTHPYAVVMGQPNGMKTMLMKFTETEINNEAAILERIFFGDTRKGDVLQRLERQEQMRQVLKAKENQEMADEARDAALTILKSPLHTYKLPNGKKIS